MFGQMMEDDARNGVDVDDILQTFADNSDMSWAREGATGIHARACETQLFDLLGMNTVDAKYYASFPIETKRDIADLLLRMVDDRSNELFCEDPNVTHRGRMIQPRHVVGYESVERIVNRVIIWAQGNSEAGLISDAKNVREYREMAKWQEVTRAVLVEVGKEKPEDWDALRSLLEKHSDGEVDSRLIQGIVNYWVRVRDYEEHEREDDLDIYTPKLAMQMRQAEMRIPRTSGRSGNSIGPMVAALERGDIEAEDVAGKLRESWSEDKLREEVGEKNIGWKKKQMVCGAVEMMLNKLGNRKITDREVKGAFRAVLEEIADEVSDVRQLKRMRQLGCGIQIRKITEMEAEMGPTKPVCGKRGRDSRRGLVEFEGREVWGVWRKKGMPGGLTNGDKRRMFAQERADLAKVRLRA